MRRPIVFFCLWVTGFWLGSQPMATAQEQCADRLSFTPVSQPNQIEWSKFPDFTLPFPVIYNGPRFTDTQASPLRHGFSNLVDVKDSEFGSLVQFRQRVIVYYGFATGLNQPWETIESPWANDLDAYRAKWDRFLSDISGGQKNSAGLYVVQASRLVLDIERFQETDARILRLKQDTRVPETYRNLSDATFIATYKQDMRNLHAEGVRYIRQHADLGGASISSYADTPVLNTYLNVPTFSWADWTTKINLTNYLVQEASGTSIGGPYYEQLDALSPSAYYFYDYPNPLARDYLAYLLFQVEVNRAWSNKPVVPWVWMRYHNESSSYPNFIQPFMAEATAIFPFFSGAAGLWLWEDPFLTQSRTDNYAAYEHFTHGLYRLSRFADMFQGTHELVIETPARDLMDKQLPVWRGVVKENKILIAAQNPYANDGQKTSLTVRYKSWQQAIELTGREVYLCRFDMGSVTATEPLLPDVVASPNPAQTTLTVTFDQLPPAATEIGLVNMLGQTVIRKAATSKTETVNVAGLPVGLYVLRIQNETHTQTKKIIISH
ncbi:T9SS type A sorting domain-containing protein [Spirosoma endophyticum]|uniref:Por secretion system C-terminal sorting domain-containing protein n=1 Tax=Spirosoma endophyticum TaxID=662367 RepID=A0A1I2D9U7_9BACT|nr:T9SS type A sorting domain-containing protein [Spirosoma endophyticum]SFE77248.1 Por secretion system C-terminal sorting domain-containing protein [Spirosoma endophyticum]